MISKFWPYKEGGPVQILDSYYYCQIVFSDFCIAYLNKGKCVLLFFMQISILKWRSLVSAEPSEW